MTRILNTLAIFVGLLSPCMATADLLYNTQSAVVCSTDVLCAALKNVQVIKQLSDKRSSAMARYDWSATGCGSFSAAHCFVPAGTHTGSFKMQTPSAYIEHIFKGTLILRDMAAMQALKAAQMLASPSALLITFAPDRPKINERFMADTSGTLSPNGYTVVKPSDASNCSIVCYVSIDRKRPTVYEFGAHGDGVTQDSVYVNAAINDLQNHIGGGELIFPAGTFVLKNLFPYEGNDLKVLGLQGSKVLADPTATDYTAIFTIGRNASQPTNISVEGMTFDGNKGANTSHVNLLWFVNVVNGKVFNSTFQNNLYQGMLVSSGYLGSSQIEVSHSRFRNTDVGLILQDSSTVHLDGVDVHDNVFDGGTSEGFDAYSSTLVKNILFHGNLVMNKAASCGIIFRNVIGLSIYGNVIKNNACGIGTNGSTILPSATINDNLIADNTDAGIAGSWSDTKMSNNKISNSGTNGIYLFKSNNIELRNNRITNVNITATDNDYIRLSKTSNVFISELIEDSPENGTPTTGYAGIRMFGAENTTITDSRICGVKFTYFADGGSTGTKLINNSYCGHPTPDTPSSRAYNAERDTVVLGGPPNADGAGQ